MIPIHRSPLPTDVESRMAALTDQIRNTASDGRATTARALWRRTSTRAGIAEPVRTVLRQMAAGIERCIVFADVPDIVALLGDRQIRDALLVPAAVRVSGGTPRGRPPG